MQEQSEIEKLRKDKRKAEKKGNIRDVAAQCNKIGELLARLGLYEDAIEEHETELGLCEALNDGLGVAIAHRRIGECLSELGDYEKALQHQQLYLELAEKCQSVLEQQRAYATLGRVHYQHAERRDGAESQLALQKAEAAFNQSLTICQLLKAEVAEVEFAEMKARLFLNLGLVCDLRNETKSCSDYFKRAIQIAEKHHLHEDLYRCQYNLSGIYQRTGNISQALRFVDMAINSAVTMKDKLGEKEGLVLKSKMLLQLGDLAAARRCLKKVLKMKLVIDETEYSNLTDIFQNAKKMTWLEKQLKIASSDDHRRLLTIHEKLGDVAAKLECYKVALDNYLQMEQLAKTLNMADDDMIPIYISIAETYKDLHQNKSAIIYFEKELNCRKGNDEQECKTWLNLANMQELDGAEYQIIKESYQNALQHAERAKHRHLQAMVLDSLKAVQVKYADKEGYSRTVAELEKLCAEFNINLDDMFDDEKSKEADSNDNQDQDMDNFSCDSDYSTEDEEEYAFQKKCLQVKLNEKGETPLHRACIAGNLRKVKALVEQGHPVNARDYCGWLPLHEAANHGFSEIVEYLLDRGARIDDRGGDKCCGITPLHDACNCGNISVIKLLVERGANVNARDDQDSTPLDSLVEYRQRSVEELTTTERKEVMYAVQLLEEKMNVDAESDPVQRHPASRKVKSYSAAIPQHHLEMSNLPENDEIYESFIEDCDISASCSTSESYRKTVPSLRKTSHQYHSNSSVPHVLDNHDIPALIPESEIVDDDWLIEDVRSTKQKLPDIENVFQCANNQSRKKSSKRKISGPDHRSTRRRHISKGYISAEEDISVDDNSFISRTDLGLNDCVAADADMHNPDSVYDLANQICVSSSVQHFTLDECMISPASDMSSLKLRLKVHINNNVILVPVHQRDVAQTVLWLSREAADRYHQLYNLRPVLSLSLPDGAKLAPSDLLSSIFVNNDEVVGTVEQWDLPSTHIQYINNCSHFKCKVYTNVKNRLIDCERTCFINLSNLCLSGQHFLPVARALQYQTSLKELSLQGNRLGDEGVGHLWQVLSTLPNLISLDLSENGLTVLSISSLTQLLDGAVHKDKGRLLQKLEKLSLSYNNFIDVTAPIFAKCICNLQHLSHLYLVSCFLSMKLFQPEQLCLSEAFQEIGLKFLDISLNLLEPRGIELLLCSINQSGLHSLILKNTVTMSQGSQLVKNLNCHLKYDICVLEKLCLDGCNLKSDSISDLCRLIVSCKTLHQLSLSCNSNICNSDIIQILQASTSSRLSHLVFENCGITSPLENLFLNCLNDKLQGKFPLHEMRFTCIGLSNLDENCLREIWVSKRGPEAFCTFSNSRKIIMTA